MAVNYKVIKEGTDFHIREISTGQLIMVLDSKEEAYKKAANLNLGGGFDGFTPKFLLEE
jgi:hypothetical protein